MHRITKSKTNKQITDYYMTTTKTISLIFFPNVFKIMLNKS